jgi:hypothetical protein
MPRLIHPSEMAETPKFKLHSQSQLVLMSLRPKEDIGGGDS